MSHGCHGLTDPVSSTTQRLGTQERKRPPRTVELRLALARTSGRTALEGPTDLRTALVDRAKVLPGIGVQPERGAAADGMRGTVVLDPHEGLVSDEAHEALGVLAEALVVVAGDPCVSLRLREAASSAARAVFEHSRKVAVPHLV